MLKHLLGKVDTDADTVINTSDFGESTFSLWAEGCIKKVVSLLFLAIIGFAAHQVKIAILEFDNDFLHRYVGCSFVADNTTGPR